MGRFLIIKTKATAMHKHVSEHCTIPSSRQLQSADEVAGSPLKYKEVAPLIKDLRTNLLNTSVSQKVELIDIFSLLKIGTLQSWTEKNDNWSMDFWSSPEKHHNFTTARTRSVEVSTKVAAWLKADPSF